MAQLRSHMHRRACLLAAGDIRLHRYVARGSRAGSAAIHKVRACGGAPRRHLGGMGRDGGRQRLYQLVLAPGSC